MFNFTLNYKIELVDKLRLYFFIMFIIYYYCDKNNINNLVIMKSQNILTLREL